MLEVGFTLICVLAVGYAIVERYNFNSRIADLTEHIDSVDAKVTQLETRMYENTISPYEQSDFDARIARFSEELNTPTYSDNYAPIAHPGVYNLDHASVTDTPIKFIPEYSE